MIAANRKLDSNKTVCDSLPKEIALIASKIKYCSNASQKTDEITKALQEMIEICQKRLDDLNSHKDEYAMKLQKRRNALADKLKKRTR